MYFRSMSKSCTDMDVAPFRADGNMPEEKIAKKKRKRKRKKKKQKERKKRKD